MHTNVPIWKLPIFRSLVVGCLTLGLAPFFPEPHIVGKIRWVLGGANGMALIDWFDLLFHGAPWLGLIGFTIWYVAKKERMGK